MKKVETHDDKVNPISTEIDSIPKRPAGKRLLPVLNTNFTQPQQRFNDWNDFFHHCIFVVKTFISRLSEN